MKNPTYYSCEAIEELINKSVCIKEGDYIRNIKEYHELFTEKTVFVNNILNLDDITNTSISKGSMVRYFYVNCSFVI